MKTWTADAIRDAVHEKGLTLRGLARSKDLHALAPSAALIRRHIPAEKAIAECIGVPLWEIWPDRWTPEGQRIDHRFLPPKSSAVATSGTRQKRKAA